MKGARRMDLTERKKQILKRVVEDYIAAAEPVGSKALAEEMGGSASSATIRNELADLVEMGYLEQPHTSAGRVPSPKGYRLYVNELMEKREVSETEAEEINEQLKSKLSGTDSVIAKAGQMVSSIVNYPVYSVTGGRREASVKRFELIAVDEMSFIVVVMGEDNRVKSQLQRSDLPFDSQRLADVKELLNTHFTGRSADEMSARLMSLSEQLSPELFLVVSKAVEYAIGVLEQSAQRNVETAGASQILKMPEYRDVDKAHDLVTFLVDNKEELPVPDDGAPLKILIGKRERGAQGNERGRRQLRYRRRDARPRRCGGSHQNGLRHRDGAAELFCRQPDADVRQERASAQGRR